MSKQGRADGSAWYERSIRNREIAGSNPAQSTFVVVMRKSSIFILIYSKLRHILFTFIETLEP